MQISLNLLELRTAQVVSQPVQRSIAPAPSPPWPGENVPAEKDELSALKAGLRKVKIFTEFVSTRKAKKLAMKKREVRAGALLRVRMANLATHLTLIPLTTLRKEKRMKGRRILTLGSPLVMALWPMQIMLEDHITLI